MPSKIYWDEKNKKYFAMFWHNGGTAETRLFDTSAEARQWVKSLGDLPYQIDFIRPSFTYARYKVSNAAKDMTINGENIAKAVKPYLGKYACVGIRTQEEPFELGEIAHKSSSWRDGYERKQKLSGICTTTVGSNFVAEHSDRKDDWNYKRSYTHDPFVSSGYEGNHVAIIVGSKGHRGVDKGEIIITEGAKVVKIFK